MPVIPAFTILGIAISSATATAIVAALISIALSLAMQFIFGHPTPKINQGQELQLKLDPTMARQVIVGTTATGGSQVFAFTYGTASSKDSNNMLCRINALSDRPCTGLVGIYEGPNLLTFAGDITAGLFTCHQHLHKGTPQMYVHLHLGSDTPTADSDPVSNSSGAWTSAHKGVGMCYVYTKFDYAPTLAFPNGEPQLVYVLNGAACYDDRKDSTVSGGSGSQRLATPSTWAYSNNTAVVISQFMRGFFTNGVRIMGVGCDTRDMDETMLFSAYNTCDMSITNADATTSPQYQTSMILTASNTAASMLTDLMYAMDGAIFDRGGQITILPGASHTPVFNLTDQDIVWTAQKSWQPKAAQDQLCNFISGTYIDKVSIYQQNTFPTLRSSAYETQDGGSRFVQTYNFNAIVEAKQVQRTTKRMFLSTRYQGTVAFTGPTYLLQMEQGDWFTMTSARWGFSTKYFVCQEIDLLADMTVAVVARETDPSVVGWTAAVDEKARSDTTWTSPSYDPPQPPIVVTPYGMYDTHTGLQDFGFTAALNDDPTLYDGRVTSIEFQYALTSTLTPTYSGGIVTLDQLQVTVVGLQPGTQYSVRARLVANKIQGDWCPYQNVTVPTSIPLTTDQILFTDGFPVTGNLATVISAAADFNASNNQNSNPVLAPFFNVDGSDVDHTLNTDGSADISMEFNWDGIEAEIDGFAVTIGTGPLDLVAAAAVGQRMGSSAVAESMLFGEVDNLFTLDVSVLDGGDVLT